MSDSPEPMPPRRPSYWDDQPTDAIKEWSVSQGRRVRAAERGMVFWRWFAYLGVAVALVAAWLHSLYGIGFALFIGVGGGVSYMHRATDHRREAFEERKEAMQVLRRRRGLGQGEP